MSETDAMSTDAVPAPVQVTENGITSILQNPKSSKHPYRGLSIVQQTNADDRSLPQHTWVIMPEVSAQPSHKRALGTRAKLRRTFSSRSQRDAELDTSRRRSFMGKDHHIGIRGNRIRNSVHNDGHSDGDEEPMDPLELADLNSIINTRKSMASAQALAKQEPENGKDVDLPCHRRSSTPSVRLVKFAPLPQVLEDASKSIIEKDDASDLDDAAASTSATTTFLAPPPWRPLSRSNGSEESLIPNDTGSLLQRTNSAGRCERLDDAESEARGRSLTRAWSPFRRQRNESLSSLSPSPSRPLAGERSRSRSRELVRAIRPGGTGMVTLLDGKRIRARQVGDPQEEQDADADLNARLWGFAALERRRLADDTKSAAASTTSDMGSPIARGKLTHSQAEEAQRRHKQEMDALGDEALTHVRENKAHANARPRKISSTVHQYRVDPSVSMPSPSPRLPRRPDARGIIVVPLPQLGMRPRYPYEGRSWLYSVPYDDDDDDDDEDNSDTQNKDTIAGQDDDGPDEAPPSSTRYRATTVAARKEVYMSHKPGKESEDEYWPKPSATRAIGSGT